MPGHQPPPAATTAFQPMRPRAILGTAFRRYRRHWRTLLPIIALAAPVAVSFPSTKVLRGPGSAYQVIVHHRVVATGGSWADTVIVALVVVVALICLRGGGPARRSRCHRRRPAGGVHPRAGGRGWGARQALIRSLGLVGGQWWHTFGTVLLTWLLLGLAVNLVDTAVGGLGHGWLAETVAQALSITLVTPFAALVGVLLYRDLRARREPLDADLLRPGTRASEA